MFLVIINMLCTPLHVLEHCSGSQGPDYRKDEQLLGCWLFQGNHYFDIPLVLLSLPPLCRGVRWCKSTILATCLCHYLPGDCGLHSHGTQGHTLLLLSSLYSVCFFAWENKSEEREGPDAYGNMTPLEYYRPGQFQSQIIGETITEFPFFF